LQCLRILIKNGSQKPAMRPPFLDNFSILFRRRFFEGSLAHVDTLLAPFGSFWAPFSAPFSINVA
jgi:hypothetical protein